MKTKKIVKEQKRAARESGSRAAKIYFEIKSIRAYKVNSPSAI